MALTYEERLRRRQSLGGSDIGVIAGVSPHQTPFELYLEKKGLSAEEDLPETDSQLFGQVFEDAIAQVYATKHAVEIHSFAETLVHPDYPFITANPDRVVLSLERLLEIKTTGIHGMAFWADPDHPGYLRPPHHVILQVNHYLGIMGWKEADVVLLNFAESYSYERYYEFPITFDAEMYDMGIQLAVKFWREHILADMPPDPASTGEREMFLRMSYPSHSDEMLPATPEATEIARRLVIARQQREHWESIETDLHNQMKELIGEKLGIEEPGVWRYTWKFTKAGGVNWKELALSLHPSDEQIQRYSRSGYRRAYFYAKGLEHATTTEKA